MKRTHRTIIQQAIMVGLLALAMSAFGCASSEPPPQDTTPVQDSEFTAPVDPTPPPPPPRAPVVPELGAIYFDYDSSSVRDDARPVLRANAEALRTVNAEVTIEGHCDERGSEEYNLALGESRAASVKKYLSNLGVSSSQMRTLSYGEAKPAAMGHDESAWRWNRRSEFAVR